MSLSTEPQAQDAPTSPAQLRRAIGGLLLVLTLASLDNNIVSPALPRILSDLGGLAHLSWVVTAFAVASTASTPLYGKLSDQFGRRPAFFVSIGIFIAGSALCGSAASMGGLIAARAAQGVGAGGLITLTQTAVADLVSPRERGRYQGLVVGVFALCSVAGPLLGGIITDVASWPWIFYLNLPVGAVAIVVLALNLPHRAARPSRAIDAAGFLLLIAATISFMLLLSWGGTVYAWRSWPIAGLAAGTLALLGVLVPVESRAAEPALPPHLFRDRVFSCGVVSISLLAAALMGGLVFLPLFFQLTLGASATEAGLRLAPLMAGMIVSSVLGGRAVTRTGKVKRYLVGGLAVGTLSFAGLAVCAATGVAANVMDVLLVALGAGLGLVMPNITTAVQSAASPETVGIATATLGFFRSLGGAFGVAVSGAILSATLATRLSAAGGIKAGGLDQLHALPPAQRAHLAAVYGEALAWTSGAAACATLFAFAVILLMPERPLRGR